MPEHWTTLLAPTARQTYHLARESRRHHLSRSRAATGPPMPEGLLNTMRRHTRWRTAVTLLCLLACTLQSFVAQTHVHVRKSPAPASLGQSIVQLDAAAADSIPDEDFPKHGRRDGPSSCPLCQIVLHGGAAPAPTFALPLPVAIAISVAPYQHELPSARVAVSFSWHGRAPPLI